MKYPYTQSDETETKGRNSREIKEMEDQGKRMGRRREEKRQEEKKKVEERRAEEGGRT